MQRVEERTFRIESMGKALKRERDQEKVGRARLDEQKGTPRR